MLPVLSMCQVCATCDPTRIKVRFLPQKRLAPYVHRVGGITPTEGVERRKMTTQEIKLSLQAKMHELTSTQVSREDIAIEKNAEEMDEIQRGGDRVLALESLTRKWQTRNLVLEA